MFPLKLHWKQAVLVALLFTGLCVGQEAQEKPQLEPAMQTPENPKEKTFEEIFPTPLLRAVALQQASEVRYLLSIGAVPNAKEHSKFEHTPILMAAHTGNLEIMKMLLKAGANIEAKNEIGITPLMDAAYGGQIETVKFLLSAGANVNARTVSGSTVLGAASMYGHVEVVRLLLKAGADVNLATHVGGTALMAAADDPEMIKALLEAGASIDAVDAHGWTAVCWAIENKQTKKLAYLIKNGAKNSPQCKSR